MQKYAIIASIMVFVIGVVSGFIFQPFGTWFLGSFTWLASLIVSLLLTWLIWSILQEECAKSTILKAIILTPLVIIAATSLIVIVSSVIMDVAFMMRLHITDFSAYYGLIQPSQKQILLNSIFSGKDAIVTIIGFVVSVVIDIVIFFGSLVPIIFLVPPRKKKKSIRERIERIQARKEIAPSSRASDTQTSESNLDTQNMQTQKIQDSPTGLCPKCSHSNSKDDLFCAKCGYALKKDRGAR